jgi:hypothetical protein
MKEGNPLINRDVGHRLDFQAPLRLSRMAKNRTAPRRPDFQEEIPEETVVKTQRKLRQKSGR